MNMFSVATIGFLASVLSVINQLPQAIKVFRTKDTHSISLVMYILVVLCVSFWLVYGIMLNDLPLIWANALALFPITYIFSVKLRNSIKGKDKWSI